MHIAINKVHPTRHTVRNPYYDYRVLAQACVELEKRHGLATDNHEPRAEGTRGRAADVESHAGVETLVSWIRRVALDDLNAAQSWPELHRAANMNGLDLQLRGAGCVFSDGDVTVKASAVARELAFARLEARLGRYEVNAHPDSRAGRTGDSPNVARSVRHRTSSESTSTVPFPRRVPNFDKAPRQTEAGTGRCYEPRPIRFGVDTTELFARYRTDRETRQAQRHAGLELMRSDRDRRARAALRSAGLRRSAIKLIGGNRHMQRILYAASHRALKRDLRKLREQHTSQRASLMDATRRVGWVAWLQEQARRGDHDALRALRSRLVASPLRGNVLAAERSASARGTAALVAPHVDGITRTGVVVYRFERAAIRDDGSRIRVDDGASALDLREALRLACHRFGPALRVDGDVQFRNAVAQVAGVSGLRVCFQDAELETLRLRSYTKEETHVRGIRTSRYDAREITQRPEAGTASGTSTRERDAERDSGRRSKAGGEDGLREMPARSVAREEVGSDRILQSDVPRDVVIERAEPDRTLRRHLPSVGAVAHVGAAPPPPSRSDTFKRAHTVRGERVLETVKAREVGRVGVSPPPAHRNRLQPMSVLDRQGVKPSSANAEPTRRCSELAPRPEVEAFEAMNAARTYIAERDEKRARGIDLPKHVPFSGDEGEYTFSGLRNVNACVLALARRADVMFVVALEQREVARWRRLQVGATVRLDSRGILRSATRRR